MKIVANDYAIIATNRTFASAFLAYKRRWEIEMLFSALKKMGFEPEATHLTNLAKLDILFTLLSVAFARLGKWCRSICDAHLWAYPVDERLHDSKLKPLHLKSHLRREKIGLSS